jgi:hypothetical protein
MPNAMGPERDYNDEQYRSDAMEWLNRHWLGGGSARSAGMPTGRSVS